MSIMITRKDLQRFVDLTAAAVYDTSGDSDCGLGTLKNEYKLLGRRILKEIVKQMGLQPGQYDIRWNPGGIACSGDHTLHAEWFYLALDDNIGSGWFYFRTCAGRKDYHGGPNQIVEWVWLIENGVKGLAALIRKGCSEPE